MGDGAFYYAIYHDLLAAGRAYEQGDPKPLLRLGAESVAAYAEYRPHGLSLIHI